VQLFCSSTKATKLKNIKRKGKVHPMVQRESKRYSSILSLTSALHGGGWSTPRLLYPRERDLVPTVYEAGWTLGCRKSRSPPGFDPQTVQPVVSTTKWAIPAHVEKYTNRILIVAFPFLLLSHRLLNHKC
jgi:hypothetical protein